MENNRRQFLVTATTSAATLAGLSMSGAAYSHHNHDGEYEEIKVSAGETYGVALDEGETYENKLIDISAERAEFSISTEGNSCTIRNVGIKGQWDGTFFETPIVAWTDDADGEVLIENLYFADGTTASSMTASYEDINGDGPAGILIANRHTGTVTVRNAHLGKLPSGGVIMDGSAAEGDVHIQDSFATDIAAEAFTVATDGSRVENSVAVNSARGGHAPYGSPTFVNSEFSNPNGVDIMGGISGDPHTDGAPVLDTVRGETTAGEVEGEFVGSAERTEPSDVDGVPLSAAEAAGGRTTHSLRVAVTNADDNPLEGARVQIAPEESESVVVDETTGTNGEVYAEALRNRTYTVTASRTVSDDNSDGDTNPDDGNETPDDGEDDSKPMHLVPSDEPDPNRDDGKHRVEEIYPPGSLDEPPENAVEVDADSVPNKQDGKRRTLWVDPETGEVDAAFEDVDYDRENSIMDRLHESRSTVDQLSVDAGQDTSVGERLVEVRDTLGDLIVTVEGQVDAHTDEIDTTLAEVRNTLDSTRNDAESGDYSETLVSDIKSAAEYVSTTRDKVLNNGDTARVVTGDETRIEESTTVELTEDTTVTIQLDGNEDTDKPQYELQVVAEYESGDPIADADVQVTNENADSFAETTGEDGAAMFEALPQGMYDGTVWYSVPGDTGDETQKAAVFKVELTEDKTTGVVVDDPEESPLGEGIVDASLDTLSVESGTGHEATVSFGDGTVAFDGLLQTPSPCYQAAFSTVTIDGSTLTIGIDGEQEQTEGCSDVIAQAEYEGEVEYEGEIDTVRILHGALDEPSFSKSVSRSDNGDDGSDGDDGSGGPGLGDENMEDLLNALFGEDGLLDSLFGSDGVFDSLFSGSR